MINMWGCFSASCLVHADIRNTNIHPTASDTDPRYSIGEFIFESEFIWASCARTHPDTNKCTNTQHRVSWAYFILLGSVSTFWLKVMLLVETCFSEPTLLLSLSCETTLLLSLSPASEGQDGKRLWKLPVPMASPDERWVRSWLGWLPHLHWRCILMPLASLARQRTYGRNSGCSFQEWMGFALCVCKEIWCRLVHESVGILRTSPGRRCSQASFTQRHETSCRYRYRYRYIYRYRYRFRYRYRYTYTYTYAHKHVHMQSISGHRWTTCNDLTWFRNQVPMSLRRPRWRLCSMRQHCWCGCSG